MMNDEARSSPHAPAEAIAVGDFRQILLWPLQLAHVHGRTEASGHWERLPAAGGPWRAAAGDCLGDAALRARHYAEFVTFMPDVRRFLYGEAGVQSGERTASPIRVFRRDDIAAMRVTLRPGAPVLDFEIVRTELHFFYDIDLAILSIELAGRGLSLALAQDALSRLGCAYPASWEGDGEGSDCCASVDLIGQDGTVLAASDHRDQERYLDAVCARRAPTVAAHWAYLLQPLTVDPGAGGGAILCRQLEHQRIPSLAFLSVDDPARIGRDDWLRLGLASPAGRASPFAADFLHDFEARHCYDRLWDRSENPIGGAARMLCSGEAFVVVAAAAPPGDEAALLARFRHEYFLLALIAHFHRAALLVFRDRLVTALGALRDYSTESVKRFKREIRQTHENFLRFTHRYWFPEVSREPTARDLFALWVAQLGTDRLFREVREEVLDMIAYLDSDGLRRQASTVVRLTVVTFFGLIGTVTASFLGMSLFHLAHLTSLEKALTFVAVIVPVTGLTLYTAAKSQRLAEFLDAVADERRSTRHKLRALLQVWRRRR